MDSRGAWRSLSRGWFSFTPKPASFGASGSRRPRPSGLSCESLESRVVLSGWGGGDLLGSLNSVGVVTGTAEVGGYPDGFRSPWTYQNTQVAQLNTDLQALKTELQSLAAKSGVTIADLVNLQTDTQSIVGASAWLDPQKLQSAVSELATAVAGGSDTSQAKTDFAALFTGTNVATTTVDKTFNDLVQTIQDSKLTADDLNAVAADQAAIKTDLSNLTSGRFGHGPGSFGPGGRASLGSNLASSLAASNVPVSALLPGGGLGGPAGHAFGQSTDSTQLKTDLQKLQTDLQSIVARSGVTIADLATLQTDSQTIAGAGVRLDPQKVQTVVTELVTAVAGGSDTSQAKTDFAALFTGTNVATTTVDKTFNGLVQTIRDSKLTSADLTLIAADKAAIQTDLTNLRSSTGSGSGSTGGTTTGSGSTGGTTGHRGGPRRFRGFGRRHR